MNTTLDDAVDFLSRHLVGLSAECVGRDGGRDVLVMSGFTLAVGDVWQWVTAGHCIRELRDLKRRGSLRECRFLDNFGPDPITTEGVLMDVTACTAWHAYDEDVGVDIGYLALPELYSDALKANGIVPLSLDDWRTQETVSFDRYYLCGILQELVDIRQGSFTVKNAMFGIEEVQQPPASLDKSLPRFYVRLPDGLAVNSIKGMSGGPILGLKQTEEGPWRYWIAAIQNAGTGRQESSQLARQPFSGLRLKMRFRSAQTARANSTTGSSEQGRPKVTRSLHVHAFRFAPILGYTPKAVTRCSVRRCVG